MKGGKRNDRPRCKKKKRKNTPRYFLPVPFDSRGVLLILDFHVAIRLDSVFISSSRFPIPIPSRSVKRKCNKISSPSFEEVRSLRKIRSEGDPS